MPALETTHPTLTELAKRLAPDGSIARIAEILTETNEILEDIPWLEGNLPTGHKTIVRTGLPEPTWRKLYGGVQPDRDETAPVIDNTGTLEAYAEVDKELADLNGNTAAFRMTMDKAHIVSMGHEVAKTIFYGNEGTKPEAFTGFAPRFNDRDVDTAQSADNVLHGGGSGSNNTSVWLVVWGDTMAHGIFPKASRAGLDMKDKGEVTIESIDGNGGRMEAYRSHYIWRCGLSVPDWRYVVRIANIDVTNLTKDADGGADLVDLMTQALELPPMLSGGRAAFYCNRTIRSFLRRQMRNSKNVNLTLDTVAGRKVLFFDEVPVRRCDALLNTEEAVPDSGA